MILIGVLLLASPQATAQTIITPTPNANGEIVVEVKPNDTLLLIAAQAGISLEELLQLNNLTEETLLQPGQLLIIGIVPPTPTSTPLPPTLTPSPTLPPPPTVTAVSNQPTGICLTAYEDIDGNGERHAGEPLVANVAFTVYNEQSVVLNYITDGFSEPACFENMVPGSYQVTRSFSAGERLTTPNNRGVIVRDGAMADLPFGSTFDAELQIQSELVTTPAPPTVLPQSQAGDVVGVETAVNNSDRPIIIAMIVLGVLLLASIFFIIMQLRSNPPQQS